MTTRSTRQRRGGKLTRREHDVLDYLWGPLPKSQRAFDDQEEDSTEQDRVENEKIKGPKHELNLNRNSARNN